MSQTFDELVQRLCQERGTTRDKVWQASITLFDDLKRLFGSNKISVEENDVVVLANALSLQGKDREEYFALFGCKDLDTLNYSVKYAAQGQVTIKKRKVPIVVEQSLRHQGYIPIEELESFYSDSTQASDKVTYLGQTYKQVSGVREASHSYTHSPLVSVKIFYCYAHEDRLLRDELEKHLGVLRRLNQIIGWHDREIQAGTQWEQEIQQHLATANIIFLLISADFIASDYCYSVEMHKALELQEAGQARVIPILLRPVDWRGVPFAHLQMLPAGAKPIISSAWHSRDEAFTEVAQSIRLIMEAMLD